MTILEDIKAGRLVVVPREASDDMKRAGWRVLKEKNDFQTRLGNSLGGTETPIYEAMIAASPDHTAGLIALVEGMEAERVALVAVHDRAARKADAMRKSLDNAMASRVEWRRLALAAEAERDALREALAGAIAAFPHIRDEQTQKALDVLRALTEKSNG